jgi:mono/diheme cytochrome c family protein
MRRLSLISLMLVAIAAFAAGCGGGGGKSSGSGGGTSSTDGKTLFASKCGSCHTLKAAGTSGTFGPNLDDLKPSDATVLEAIKSGPGPMPNNLYEGAQAEAVAKFVSQNAGK